MGAYKVDKFAVDHPSGQDRVFDLNDMVEGLALSRGAGFARSAAHFPDGAGQAGRFVLPVKDALIRYPRKRHQRTGALRPCHGLYAPAQLHQGAGRGQQPDRGRAEQSLFYEARGQIYMSLTKPGLAIADYQKSAGPASPRAAVCAWRWPPRSLPPHSGAGRDVPCRISRPRPWWRMTMPSPGIRPPRLTAPLKNEPMANLATAELLVQCRRHEESIGLRHPRPRQAAPGRRRLAARRRQHRRRSPLGGASSEDNMRGFGITLAAAIGGAGRWRWRSYLTLAQNGLLPINDRQMQAYLMLHPELVLR